MRTTTKGLTALAAIMMLAACSGESNMAAAEITTTTKVEQLSQLDWMEMTAAPTAAQVTNNNLIMMR